MFLKWPKVVPNDKDDKKLFSKKNYETHQIDQWNALNMKIYVVGVKNDKNGSKLAKIGRLNFVLVISSSEWGGGELGGGGGRHYIHSRWGLHTPRSCELLWVVLVLV